MHMLLTQSHSCDFAAVSEEICDPVLINLPGQVLYEDADIAVVNCLNSFLCLCLLCSWLRSLLFLLITFLL